MNERQAMAQALIDAGVSIIPIRPDGTKAPTLKWEVYQHQRACIDEVHRWFRSMHSGIGIVCGEVSRNLEVLDFDDAEVFEPWTNLVRDLYEGLFELLPIVQTPSGGYHVYYRCQDIAGNQKLARAYKDGKADATRIETRGEGGYVLSPWCHVDCHEARRSYQLLQGEIRQIPLISQDARKILHNSARLFNEYIEPPKPKPFKPSVHEGERPGDIFNATHSWHQVLEPHGWKAVHTSGGCTLWKRPGKDEQGWSARTGYKGYETLRVFSTNAHPFIEDRAYTKFTCYCLLTFGGDFQAAAKSLIEEKPRERPAAKI